MLGIEGKPKSVAIAILLLGGSFTYRAFIEIAGAFQFAEQGQPVSFYIGRAIIPTAIFLFQLWVLRNTWSGKNWARVAVVVVVLLYACLTALLLSLAVADLLISPIPILSHLVCEVGAVVILLSCGSFFDNRARTT